MTVWTGRNRAGGVGWRKAIGDPVGQQGSWSSVMECPARGVALCTLPSFREVGLAWFLHGT